MRDMRARQYRAYIAHIVIVSDLHIEITYWQYWCNATGAYRFQRGEFLEVICPILVNMCRYVCSDTNPTIGTKSSSDMYDMHLIADTSKDSYRVHIVKHIGHRYGLTISSNGVHIMCISWQIMKISQREAICKIQDISIQISNHIGIWGNMARDLGDFHLTTGRYVRLMTDEWCERVRRDSGMRG